MADSTELRQRRAKGGLATPRSQLLDAQSSSRSGAATGLHPHEAATLLQAAALVAACYFAYALPTPLPADAPATAFSEQRARTHLHTMIGYGVRTVGSVANEIQSPRYIANAIQKIQHAAPQGVEIEMVMQHPSGSFHFDFLGGMTNVYANVTNVLARISFARKAASGEEDYTASRANAILLSAHFDSALGSPAATDDLVNIAGMLELLRSLSVSSPLQHSVVFNFNGAEETINQAAHGFITQHEWVSSIKAFINMEGAGAGGKSFMMQTGPKAEWLAEAFASSAPHPTGSTLLEEIFQSGIVPGDTDFRIYRDYGSIPGVDMIELSGDYYYHTKNDDERHVAQGQIQNMFDNVQSMLRVYANDDMLGHRPAGFAGSSVVFYDVWGLGVVVYSHTAAACLHVAVVLLLGYQLSSSGAWESMRASPRQIQSAVWTHILATLAAFVAPLSIGIGLVASGNALRWLPILPLGPALFGSTALAASTLVYQKRGGVSHLPSLPFLPSPPQWVFLSRFSLVSLSCQSWEALYYSRALLLPYMDV